MDAPAPVDSRLAVIQGILDTAFFSPLHKNDWLAFRFGAPALLRLEETEAFDLFVRSALAAEVMHPEEAEGRTPLAWLSRLDRPEPVLAHVLASLRHDRPLLFHRTLLSLSAVSRQEVKPEDFELVEDFLDQALRKSDTDLAESAAGELEVIAERALKAAGTGPESPDPRLAELAGQVLALPQAAELASEAELRLWMALGEGLEGVPPELRPGVMVEAWRRWVAAVLGLEPNLELLGRLHPGLDLTAPDLALYAPPEEDACHVIEAACPFCGEASRVEIGREIKSLASCPHLIYVGTSDEVHLLEVLSHFELGRDFRELLASYYQSPADLEMFATIVNDLYEMLANQGRLAAAPVSCQTADRAFYNLLAFFQGPAQAGAPEGGQAH
jgi:hypothetical protein